MSDLPYHYVWRRYADQEQARRLTVEPFIKEVGMKAPPKPANGSSLHERAMTLARNIAGYFASEDYRLMLFLVVRDATRYPWLRSTYTRHIIAPLRREIEDMVRDYGRRLERYAVLRKGAAERFVTELETHFALQSLRPVPRGFSTDIEGKAQPAVAELLASIDLLDLSQAA